MPVFVDTSAFLAVLDADDAKHSKAKEIWQYLVCNEVMFSSNYVILESFALIQRRLGMEAVQLFQEDILPLVEVLWINEEIHRTGVSQVLSIGQRNLSLVDCVSFDVMRQFKLDKVFCFDSHFEEHGFEDVSC